MCGVAGIVALTDAAARPTREDLARMAGALLHRGPDEQGAYLHGRVGLAHTRLAIVDVATGQQPMRTANGASWLVFNGEVFNHVELREELEALGRTFRTRSDTEVILQAYEAWGTDAFRRFNGQFAVALWDVAEGALVLARDYPGIVPLFYTEHAGRVIFASEVKAIFAGAPDVPRELDPWGLRQAFTFWTPVPPDTAFVGIRDVLPGHVRVYRGGSIQDRAFAGPSFPDGRESGFRGSLGEATEAVRAALARATRLRMLRADVPVGSYLSGGLDSSVVAALGRVAKNGEPFATYSLRFADAEYDETPFQHAMAAHLGTAHEEIVVTRDAIAAVFPKVVAHAERPILRTAPAPLMLLSGLVRSHGTKVVLTGEGADEVFAGYDIFREAKVRRFWARQPTSTWRPLLLDRLYPYLARSPVTQRAMARKFFGRGLEHHAEPGFAHGPRWEGTSVIARLLAPAVRDASAGRDPTAELLATLPEAFSRWTPLAQDQHLEIRTLLSGYLLSAQGDRMLMANGVEGRFPFLDPDVMALADSLPPAYKLHVLDEKHVLKRAGAGLVPDVVRNRTKQPYRAPDALSFVGPAARGWVAEALSPEAVRAAGTFDATAVDGLWQKCLARAESGQFSNGDNMALVAVLSTQLLHTALVARAPAATQVPSLVFRD